MFFTLRLCLYLTFYRFLSLQVGIKNTTGRPYRGHFSIWMTNELKDLKIYLKDSLVGGYTGPETLGWLNVNWYKPTSEVPVGVLSIPAETRREYGLADYAKPPANTKPPRHNILVELQGTKKAILPVHTQAEHRLYQSFMQGHLDRSRAPNWARMTKDWNMIANRRDDVYYKVCDPSKYLSSYLVLTFLKASGATFDEPQSVGCCAERQTVLT